MTRAQWIFTIALGLNAVFITAVSAYVARTTMWGNRWYRRQR